LNGRIHITYKFNFNAFYKISSSQLNLTLIYIIKINEVLFP